MTDKQVKAFKFIGITLSILGGVSYVYGFYFAESATLINWGQNVPDLVMYFFPNWQAEIGFAVSMIGTFFMYYPDFKAPQEA